MSDSLKQFDERFRKLTKAMQSRQFMERLAKLTANAIVRRTRQGIGISGGQSAGLFRQVKLKDLSPTYVKYRRNGLVEFKTREGDKVKFRVRPPFMSALTKPGQKKSNLTFTGQMLDAVDYTSKKGSFSIFIKDSRRWRDKTKLSNNELAEYHHYTARPRRRFLGLDNKTYRVIKAEYDRYLRKQISIIFR